ncbi:hypothetical protein N5C55_26780 [Pseudomonas otitidis]|uniref:hypothetical protein n=1 Tax=Metapseudomonas otitidis TaxID=319939 RepID=UPI002447B742|nr:hypothetical protein [Pseudomonas otitidis]MDH1106932.1 hypothetical protein [Pseudomonas otitidis]MDH1161795.1 hypothetical protein [Pseudomonas otitidis]MDH1165936.1 hypothetical protein [Pseudomonas otitidis]
MPLRRSLIVPLAAVALAAVVPLGFIWIITSAKLELGGASPDEAVVGSVERIGQRAMEQYCTGVVATPRNTWLVGRMEGDRSEGDAVGQDLGQLIRGEKKPDDEEEHSFTPFSSGFTQEAQATYLSRLDDQGRFVQVAHLDETACLVANADGSSLFLLTGVDRPGKDPLEGLQQTVVLRSDDQGASWQVLPDGFFPEADDLAWSLKPYFHDADQVWAWATLPQSATPSAGYGYEPDTTADNRAGLYYSPDRGRTRQALVAPENLLVSLDEIRKRAPADAEWGDSAGTFGTITPHIWQYDDDHAALWIGQSFLYGKSGGDYLDTPLFVTTRAELVREGGQWRIGPLQRDTGVLVEELVGTGQGQVYGVISREGTHATEVAEWQRESASWQVNGELPSPFWPLQAFTGLRLFLAGDGVLLANTDSRYQVPQWLSLKKNGGSSRISADAVFYSRDGGRSWSRLAIAGYLGVLGLDRNQDQVFWAKGNWYDSNDRRIYRYGLK